MTLMKIIPAMGRIVSAGRARFSERLSSFARVSEMFMSSKLGDNLETRTHATCAHRFGAGQRRRP